jgi:hypothetical protein
VSQGSPEVEIQIRKKSNLEVTVPSHRGAKDSIHASSHLQQPSSMLTNKDK